MASTEHGLLPLPKATSVSLSYTLQLPPHPTHKFALISHPLARLGGSSRDHVVRSLACSLVRAGWGVVTYDSRGAGRSGGSCSFSGIVEAEDYEMILHEVVLPLFPPSSLLALHLLLAGYSAGSLSTSLCAPPRNVRTDYLLISYPLSVLWALTLFHSSTFKSGIRSLVAGLAGEGEGKEEEGRRILSIWGDGDQFTGVDKYRNWSKGFEGTGKGWTGVEVSGADHFWGGEGKREEMIEEVLRWLDSE